MADQNGIPTMSTVPDHFNMHFGDQGAGGIEDSQLALVGFIPDLFGYPMCAENHGSVIRNLIQLINEYSAFLSQGIDNESIVDDFMPHIDRCTKLFKCSLNDLDSTIYTGTKAPWIGKFNLDLFHWPVFPAIN
jgi:hypothetical protein